MVQAFHLLIEDLVRVPDEANTEVLESKVIFQILHEFIEMHYEIYNKHVVTCSRILSSLLISCVAVVC